MRTLARRLLLPCLTTLALTATACSSPTHTGSADQPKNPTASASTSAGDGRLDVASAPEGSAAPTAVARARAGQGRPEKSSLKVASYD
ncbi:hypothetical protein ACFV17_39780, partial [Streptomyces sp. NPDC059656]